MTKRSSVLTAMSPLAVAIFCALGCGSPSEAQTNVHASYDEETGRLRELSVDSDKNGKPDSIAYMEGTRVLRVEIDKNEDGKVERWEYYGADQTLEKVGLSRANDGHVDAWAYQGADGTLVKMEISTRRNGKVQRTEMYEKGALVRVDEDTDGNGAVDKWEAYSNGTLTSVAFDTEGTGRPNRRLVYGDDGHIRIETRAAATAPGTNQ